MARQKVDPWMRCTYSPRPFPEAIMYDNGTVLGPFCAHCGGPSNAHGPNDRCPRQVGGMWPPPSCPCHAVTTARSPKPGEPIRVVGADGSHWTTINENGKALR